MKNLYYGLLHVAVAITSILFVTGVTGINLSVAFLTVGIGTLLFHWMTKNKIAVLLGVSGSYIAGMAYISETLGPQYVAGGVLMAGALYFLVGTITRIYPKTLSLFPGYVLNMATFLIALTLMPIGADLVKGSPVIAGITILALVAAQSIPKLKAYGLPFGLVVGTVAAAAMGQVQYTPISTTLVATMPAFSWAAFTTISVVAIAVIFETLSNTKMTANAQGIELNDKDVATVIQADGVASILSGMVGGLPLTSYCENAGFIYSSGWKNPNAQIWSSFIFIAMGLIPGAASIFGVIPFVVYGAILVFLFALVAANAIRSIEVTDENMVVMILMILAFYVTPQFAPAFSPIAAAIIVGMVGNAVYRR
jgi:uracil permease